MNPVIPEVMNMCAFEAIGLSVEKLRSGRELDGHMNKGEMYVNIEYMEHLGYVRSGRSTPILSI